MRGKKRKEKKRNGREVDFINASAAKRNRLHQLRMPIYKSETASIGSTKGKATRNIEEDGRGSGGDERRRRKRKNRNHGSEK